MEAMGNWANDEKLAAEAMTRIAAEAAALSADELSKVNLDLQQATATILGVLPEVMALRERIVKELPAFDITKVDKLEDYALALRFAHAAYQTAMQPPDVLKDLAVEASELRERLLADAQSLSLRALIDPRKLESLKGANGIHNIAQDLQMVSAGELAPNPGQIADRSGGAASRVTHRHAHHPHCRGASAGLASTGRCDRGA